MAAVNEVSDTFLLQMAEIAGGLFGLFMVGMLFAIPLGLSLTLVVLDLAWSTVLFALLSVVLIVANLDTGGRIRDVRQETGSTALWINEVVGTIGVVAIVVLPWLLGGFDPTREDLTWAILISFATAFCSLATLILSVFDIAMSH